MIVEEMLHKLHGLNCQFLHQRWIFVAFYWNVFQSETIQSPKGLKITWISIQIGLFKDSPKCHSIGSLNEI